MSIARRHEISHLMVESDFKVLVDMVTNKCKLNRATPILICRIWELVNLFW